MQLFLARHGQTDWNASDLLQGQADIPLNATGIKQAELLRDQIHRQGLHFDAIYASPLERTWRTAEIIAGGQSIIASDLLKERDAGEFSGKPCGMLFDHEIDFLDPDLNAGDFGVEPIQAFRDRAAAFLRYLHEHHSEHDKILAVTSNGFMKNIYTVQIGESCPLNFQNSEIYLLEI